MALAAEQVYNDLNGEEVKEILIQRFTDLLSQLPDLQAHLTLPRVCMQLNLTLDVWGRTPNPLQIQDDFTVRMKGEVTVNSNPSTGGHPADLIREEHDLPVMEPRRIAGALQDIPVIRERQPVMVGGRPYAANITLDRGGPVQQGFEDYLGEGQDVLSTATTKNSIPDRATPGAIQQDFKESVVKQK